MNLTKTSFIGVFSIFLFLIAAVAAMAFPGEVDAGFNPYVSRAKRSTPYDIRLVKSARLADGKILISGNFSAIDGYSRSGIFRLNADGSFDPTFNPPAIYNYEYFPTNIKKETLITGIAVRDDGKILIAGDFTTVDGVYRPKIAQLNADGSPDVAFNAAFTTDITNSVFDVGVQPGGKFILGGDFCLISLSPVRCDLVRLNSDGTVDPTFANIQVSSRFKFAPDGTILHLSNFQTLRKLDANGVVDNTFTPVTISFTNTEDVFDILAEPDGSLLVGGRFEFVNGFFKRFLVKLQPNGAIDTNFQGTTQGPVAALLKLPDGKIMVGGSFNDFNTLAKQRVVRIEANGTLDNTFNYPFGNEGKVNIIVPITNNRFIIAGEAHDWNRLERLENNGSKDLTFSSVPAAPPLVNALAKQADGKILVGGRFTSGGGQPRNNIVRFNADGTLDTGFVLTSYVGNFVLKDIKVLPNGKILFIGSDYFTIVRLNSDGSVDTTFNSALPINASYNDLAVLPDGSIIAVGVSGLAKLTPNGSLDATFFQNHTFRDAQGFAGRPNKVAIQSDGKIIVVGEFVSVSSVARSRIVRFNQGGSIDTTFDSSLGANANVNDVEIQSDGKILVGGNFTGLAGSLNVRGIGRLNPDATIDNSFTQTVNENIFSIEVQSDGKIVIGGAFTQVGGASRSGLARLNSNGSNDSTFQVGKGTNGPVNELIIQNDGKILIGGEFTSYDSSSKIGIARISANNSPFDFDGDGRADITVYRPSTFYWYQLLGPNYQFAWSYFGAPGDILTPADYDGDGKTDISIFRPSAGIWVYASSANGGTQLVTTWGQSGDIPLPSDFNGDGKADFIVYRPSTNFWYRYANGVGTMSFVNFGAVNDKPVIGDFDGDGKSDPAVFRPSTGEWFYASSLNGGQHLRAAQWGLSTDQLVPADYDGDGKTDPAIYRDGLWAIYNSSNGSFTILTFGLASDKPVAADYDGDGKADVAVYRPSDGTWYLLRSTSGFQVVTFGASTDIPAPNAYVR